MAYSALAVANAFIQRALDGELRDLTPMKLQKLMFFAQSWSLARDNFTLFEDFFCRWSTGPVLPFLYHEFKQFGDQPITELASRFNDEPKALWKVSPTVGEEDAMTWTLVDDVIHRFGSYTDAELSDMTKEPGSAWSKSGPGDNGPIPNHFLCECFALEELALG